MQNGPPNISPQPDDDTNARSPPLAHSSEEMATPGESGTHSIQSGVRKVVVKGKSSTYQSNSIRSLTRHRADIAVKCLSLRDAIQLDEPLLTIFGLIEENTGFMEKVSPMRWRCPSIVSL
jgi:hypothetical protein